MREILVVKKFNLASWRKKMEDIYLNYKGEIYCDSFTIKDYKNKRCKYWFEFITEYLDKKRKKDDITDIFNTTIGDLRQMMWSKNVKSISRKRIEEIVHWENQISDIKDEIIKRVKKYIDNKIYHARLSEIEKIKKENWNE